MTSPFESTGSSELRVAVITPYCLETVDVLQQAHESVRAQTYPCTHFLIADGHPREDVANWPVQHILLPKGHADLGNTARAIGSVSAMTLGFDAIAYLEADNWYYPSHIEAMVNLHRLTGADVCTATRSIHRRDGTLMFVDEDESDGKRFVDTSCLFLCRAAFHLLPAWAMMPRELVPINDVFMWRMVLGYQHKTAHAPEPTVAYQTCHRVHYARVGEPAPPGAESNEESIGKAFAWWRSLSEEDLRKWAKLGFSLS